KVDPDITLSADERPIGGLGILMIKKMMDEVDYRYLNGRNNLIIKKKLTK
ncbi:MAG: ATP-binding protein, partial [Dehalococcoidales bacterium]|nr:ATP-binding protein [Dehalococcoidales bacterium]